MAEPFSTQCPHCDKVLKLKSSAALGKKAPCPKCGESFVVKRYEEPEDDWESLESDDYEEPVEEDDDFEEEVQPRRSASKSSSRSGSRGKSSKKKKSSGLKWLGPALLGLGAVCVLGAIIGVGIFAASSFGGKNVIDMSYLPADAEMLVHVRPREMWNAPVLAPIRNNPQVQAAMQQAAMGVNVTIDDFESLTLAGVDMIEKRFMQRFTGAVGGVAKAANAKTVGVIRLNKDVAEAVASGAGAKKEAYGSQSIYLRQEGGKSVASWAASPRMLVFGDLSEVKKAIDRGPKEPRLSRYDFINVQHQLVMAIAPENPLSEKGTGGATPTQRLENAMKEHTKAAAFGMSLNSDANLEISIVGFSSSGAAAIKQEFDALLADTKSKMGALPPMPLAVLQSLMESGRDAVNSAQSGQSGSMVTVTAKVPGKIATQLQQLSESVPGMGFPSGFGSPPPMGQTPAIGINPTGAPPGFPSGFTPPQAGAVPPGANLPAIPRVPNAGSPPGFPGGPPQSPSSKP